MLKKPTYRQRLGAHGEALAEKFLVNQGYKILERNFAKRQGEIDLVAEKAGELVFVEVKIRNSKKFGGATEAVTRTKYRKLETTAWRWLQENDRENSPWRIDLIALDKTETGYTLQHLPYFE